MRSSWLVAALLVACSSAPVATTVPPPTTTTAPRPTTSTVAPTTTSTTTASTTSTTVLADPLAPPDWLGKRLLPLRPDGFGEVQPTPPDLFPRAIRTEDLLPPPEGAGYQSTIGPIPPDVLARSSWRPECPIGVEELAYVTVTHWGFDGDRHTGELIVAADVAEDMVGVFGELYDIGFPIEQMRVVTADAIDAHPTGDGNDTSAFACRPAAGSESWSMHAHGLAIDINPFHNPYARGDLVLPELASAYLEREPVLAGMVTRDVVDAFARIGWRWGGNWSGLIDWMHFSSNGR